MSGPVELRHTRAAVASAREGLELIKELEPHSYRALFLAFGLVTNTRHVWHALTVRDKAQYPDIVRPWMKSPPKWCERVHALLKPARDLLIKEWIAIPLVASGSGHYAMSIHIPAGPEQEAVLTSEEREDREHAARLATAMGSDGERIRAGVRIDLLEECARTLDLWDAEICKLEGR